MNGKRRKEGVSKISRTSMFIVFLCTALLFAASPMKASAEDGQKKTVTHANLVLFAYFSDEDEPDWFNKKSDTYQGDDITEEMTNAERYMHYYDGEQNRSFSTYMSKISGGAYQVQNVFPQYDSSTGRVEAVQLSVTEEQAKAGNYDLQIIKELKEKMDLSAFKDKLDMDKNKVIDNVSLVLQGGDYTSSASGVTPTLRSHKFNYYIENWGNTGIGAETFNMLSTTAVNGKRAGVITHEYLHSLGYPDLYRNGGSDYPVGNWDIMSGDGRQMVYPLAYLRMAVSGWVQIPEIDDACTNSTKNEDGTTTYSLELETISDTNLCNAVMLTSPANPYEKFVIEVRERPEDFLNGDSLDGGIPKAGVIVYRVDTTVADYSNFFGKTGVYVFGTESGKTREDAALDATNATYGNSDMNSSDRAITFSNGTNTGIVVSEVSNIRGGKAALKVTVPDWTSLDPWTESQGIGNVYSANLVDLGDRLVAVSLENSNGNPVNFYEYEDARWEISGKLPVLTGDVGIKKVKLISCDENIFVAYIDGGGAGHVMYLESKEWKEVTDSNNQGIGAVANNDLDIGVAGGSLYISYSCALSSGWNYEVKMRKIAISDGSVKLENAVSVDSNDMFGSTRILEQQGILVIAYKNGNDDILLKKQTDNGFTDMRGPGTASSYDVITYNKELYFASASSEDLSVSRYDSENDKWIPLAEGNKIDSNNPKLAVAQGNLYVVTGPATSGKNGVYAYEVTDSGLKSEGLAVDSGVEGNDYSMVANGDRLFVGYRDENGGAVIKEKKISNSLLSLSITPPNKVSYVAGEKMSLDGLVVTANYQNGTRELASGEYEVTGFGVEEGGQRIAKNVGDYYATVTLSSDKNINNTFAYNVSALTWISSVKKGMAESREFVYGDEISVTVQRSTDVMGKQVALYYRKADGSRTKLTEPVTITDSSCEITYDTIAKKLPTGTDLQLEACLVDGDTVIGGGCVSITLTKKPLTASITGTTTKTYDGTVNAPAGAALRCEGVLNSDKVSLSGTIQYDSPNAGTRIFTVKDFKVQGDDVGFYESSQPTANAKIEKASPTEPKKWNVGELKAGKPLSDIKLSGAFTGINSETLKGTLGWKNPNAKYETGTHTAAWTFTPESANYEAVEGNVTIRVVKAEDPAQTKKPCSHSYANKTVKATTSKNGSIRKYCTKCGVIQSVSTIPAAKTVKLSATSYTYNGKTKKPSVSVIGNNGKKLASSNYSVSYSSGRKKVGKYTVKVTFKGNYSGTVSKTFKINPKGTSVSKVKAGKKRMTVKWKKLSKTYVTGYQIQYSTDKKFKKSVKTSTVTKYKTSSKTIKKLKAKKKYYVRIRTYKKVGSVKYYSGWSKVKSVKVK